MTEGYRYNERNDLTERISAGGFTAYRYDGEELQADNQEGVLQFPKYVEERKIKMLLGDPYKFAIIMETIKEGDMVDDTWHNGVLLFCVDGAIFPKRILTAPLGCEITPLKENLGNIAVNDRIFHMKKREAFEHIYNTSYPENWDEDTDFQYEITPETFPEDNCDVFAVSDGDQVRILAAKSPRSKDTMRPVFNNATIKEAFISVQELKEIARALEIE